MESTAMHFVVYRKEDYRLFQWVQSILDIPAISKSSEGLSTQLSIGVNYWRIAHRDSDYFFTFLSCLSGDHKLHDETVCYFCFLNIRLQFHWSQGMWSCLIHLLCIVAQIAKMRILLYGQPMSQRKQSWLLALANMYDTSTLVAFLFNSILVSIITINL